MKKKISLFNSPHKWDSNCFHLSLEFRFCSMLYIPCLLRHDAFLGEVGEKKKENGQHEPLHFNNGRVGLYGLLFWLKGGSVLDYKRNKGVQSVKMAVGVRNAFVGLGKSHFALVSRVALMRISNLFCECGAGQIVALIYFCSKKRSTKHN